jgi:hypothetical protein
MRNDKTREADRMLVVYNLTCRRCGLKVKTEERWLWRGMQGTSSTR